MEKLNIEFPFCGLTARAAIDAGDDTALEENLKAFLREYGPVKMICHHTGSTGGLIDCFPQPREEYPIIAAKHPFYLCEGKQGQLGWNGNHMLLLHETLTEPLRVGHGIVAQVDPESMDAYMTGCREVWNHCFLYHRLAVIVISLVEE